MEFLSPRVITHVNVHVTIKSYNSPWRNFLFGILQQGDWLNGRPHVGKAAGEATRRVRRRPVHVVDQVRVPLVVLDDHVLISAADRLERRRRCGVYFGRGSSGRRRFRLFHFNHRHEMTRLGRIFTLTIFMFSFHRGGAITDFVVRLNCVWFAFRTIFTVRTRTLPLLLVHRHRSGAGAGSFAVTPTVYVGRQLADELIERAVPPLNLIRFLFTDDYLVLVVICGRAVGRCRGSSNYLVLREWRGKEKVNKVVLE